MKKWLYLFEALRKGSILANPEKRKEESAFVAAVVGAAVALYQFGKAAGFLPEGLDEGTITYWATGGAAIAYTGYQMFVTFSTSKKVGLPEKKSEPTTEVAVDKFTVTTPIVQQPAKAAASREVQPEPKRGGASSGSGSYDWFMGGD